MGPVGGGYWSRHHKKSVGNRRGGRSDVGHKDLETEDVSGYSYQGSGNQDVFES